MIYRFGPVSRSRLDGVHPALVEVLQIAINVTRQDFAIHDGLPADIAARDAIGRGASWTIDTDGLSQADTWASAADLVPFVDGGPDWSWLRLCEVAVAVRRGLDFVNEGRAAQGFAPLVLTWGGVGDRDFATLPADAEGLAAEVAAYLARSGLGSMDGDGS